MITRQAPVARDLRTLITMQLVSSELERMGDHDADIAKNAIRLAALPPINAVVELPELAKAVRQQVREAIQAFVAVDVVAARQICARDDVVDQLYRQLFEELLVSLRERANVPQATSLLFVAHALERVGDRVTNICEDLLFLVTGEIEELN
jgi:phosphate transport system protein